MYSLIVENKYGDKMEITHNPAYVIKDIDGLNPPEANINTTHYSGFDGSKYNSSYIQERSITITIAINANAEENRINLYKYFKTKMPVKLYYKNSSRDVYISGYVQSMPIAFFEMKQVAQILIMCPDPLFRGTDVNIQQINNVTPQFEFPMDLPSSGVPMSTVVPYSSEQVIKNGGDVESGFELVIRANGNVDTPEIRNVTTGESMGINTTMQSGNTIVLNTRKGEKTCYKQTGTSETSLTGYIAPGSTWLQMIPGDNVFELSAISGLSNMYATFYLQEQYEGV